ncbi:hypothetical protein M117_1523 [Bacteroides fragilis str. 3774 T13]|nr:hypothetical protein M117_1523 [Bacteroides fragilis str. 3774 T13]
MILLSLMGMKRGTALFVGYAHKAVHVPRFSPSILIGWI